MRAPLLSLLLAAGCMQGAVEGGAVPAAAGCTRDSQCPDTYFCVAGACQAVAAACTDAKDCGAGDVCRYGHCLPGCGITGCGQFQVCDATTNLCVTPPPADAGTSADAGSPDAGAVDAGSPPPAPDPVTNGDFETGTLSGWTTTGAATVASTGAYSGAHALQLGTTDGSHDSTASQQIDVPAGNPQLTFWYRIVCQDAVRYDWATVTVTSPSGTLLATPLQPSCSDTGAWAHATADLSAFGGQSVVLVFANHDDGYASDPTYTLFDAIDVTQGAPPAQDFVLSATPGALTGAGSVTIGAAPSGGFSGAVSLSVSGAPGGATASLNTTSLSPGSNATLSLSPGTGAAGTYSVVVTGTSGALTRTAAISWTIAGAVTPNFSVSASPASVSGQGSSTISVAPSGGFTGAVSLSVSGAPSGATASLGSSSIATSGSTTLGLTPGSAAAGTYSLTVKGTSGALTHTATVSWTIAAAVCTPDTWGSYASGFMQQNCAYCHSFANSYSGVRSNASSCQSRIQSGNMPQDHVLSSSDKQRILQWFSCGMPQ